jgi:hypothetical protein
VQLTENWWFKVNYPLWWMLIVYSAVELVLVYTYQFEEVINLWSKLYNSSNLASSSDISEMDL